MVDLLIAKLHDTRFMMMLMAAIAVTATAYTLLVPLFVSDGLTKRMKAVASERERLRQRERDRLANSGKVSLRQTPKQLVSNVVSDFNLTKWLAQEAALDKLVMAGYRGQAPYVTFLFFRLVTPIVFASSVSSLTAAVAIIGLAAAAHQGWSSNLYTMVSDTFPRTSIASVMGIGGAAGAIGGMIMAKYVGQVLETVGTYVPVFLWAGSAYLIALLLVHLLVPRLDARAAS